MAKIITNEDLAASIKDLTGTVKGLANTIEDLATTTSKQFNHVYEEIKNSKDELKSDITNVRNDVQILSNRFDEHDKNQKMTLERLEADTFALKHVSKDHEKRITILEQKPA